MISDDETLMRKHTVKEERERWKYWRNPMNRVGLPGLVGHCSCE